jgi:hypothetical protein
MAGPVKQIRRSNADPISQQRSANLSGRPFFHQRSDHWIQLRTMIHLENVLGRDAIRCNQSSDEPHAKLVPALEEEMWSRCSRSAGSGEKILAGRLRNRLACHGHRQNQYQEEIAHTIPFLLRKQGGARAQKFRPL